ncbi:hypothetical protein [Chromobacterium violaceum]|uniref:hypothetical protein n=1 Tax=Chromobacterium violaceum TaxID=536 RepID=UPI0015963A68|nr:hypothetical protein [Chromobacterium violaceum]
MKELIKKMLGLTQQKSEAERDIPEVVRRSIHQRRYTAAELNRAYGRVKQRMSEDARAI